jgi:hypothetical protein
MVLDRPIQTSLLLPGNIYMHKGKWFLKVTLQLQRDYGRILRLKVKAGILFCILPSSKKTLQRD